MTDTFEKKAPKGRSALTASAIIPSSGLALADHAILNRAVESFIRDHCCFESMVAINEAIDDIGKCVDVQSAFAVPLRHKLFSMDAALRWVLFLAMAPDRAVQEGDSPFSNDTEFSTQTALDLVATVYDLGVQETVWDHFEPDEEGEDDEEGGDDEEGEDDEEQ